MAPIFEPLFDSPYEIRTGAGRLPVEPSQLLRLPIQGSSTKSLVARSYSRMKLPSTNCFTVNLNGLLVGEFDNPLSVDLIDSVLMYENWAYPLNRTFFSGDTIRIEEELTPKNLEWKLQRRRVVDMKDQTTPWDRTNIGDLERIIELLMFHEAAGGRKYTRLTHEYQRFVDLSDHLQTGRAILLGRCDSPAAAIKINGSSTNELHDQQYTYYRIVYPVQGKAPAAEEMSDPS